MNMISRLFAPKTPITSATIRAEIERAEFEIAAHGAQLEAALAGIAVMNDSQHAQVEADAAAIKRAIMRLEARANHLTAELPNVIAAEEAAAKAAADEALRLRAEAARRANTKDAAALLQDYDKLASQMGDIFARLGEIASETDDVNAALRLSRVAEAVSSYTELHRKHPDRHASEQREVRRCWVYPDGTVRDCTNFDDKGQPIMPRIEYDRSTGTAGVPHLEQREIVVARAKHRPGHYEANLTGIVLPPAFAGGAAHWPR